MIEDTSVISCCWKADSVFHVEPLLLGGFLCHTPCLARRYHSIYPLHCNFKKQKAAIIGEATGNSALSKETREKTSSFVAFDAHELCPCLEGEGMSTQLLKGSLAHSPEASSSAAPLSPLLWTFLRSGYMLSICE